MAIDNGMADPDVTHEAQTRAQPATPAQVWRLGCGIVAVGVSLFAALVWIWPSTEDSVLTIASHEIHRDVQLLVLVMIAGALGSFIHAATSFGDFVGNEKLTRSWLWWYLMKPFVGAALAVVLYLAFRGGFLSATVSSDQINLYGVAALAGLSGMFSKQATDKLSEVFTTLFRTAQGGGDEQRKDSLANEQPTLTQLKPDRLEPATQNLQLLATGTQFVKGSVVHVNGEQRETEYRSPSELRATLRKQDVAIEREHDITVFNPLPGGGSSKAMRLVIAAKGPDLGENAPLEDPEQREELVDGCSVEIHLATPDESLPPARGGVSTR